MKNLAVALAMVPALAVLALLASELSSMPILESPPSPVARATAEGPKLPLAITVRPGEVTRRSSVPCSASGAMAEARADRVPVALDAGARVMSVERLRQCAAALAASRALPAGGEDALFTVLSEEQTRRLAILRDLRRNPNEAGTAERVRTELDALEDWKTEKLAMLGSDRESRPPFCAADPGGRASPPGQCSSTSDQHGGD